MSVEFPKWGQLIENFCSNKSSPEFYEPFATRRYNFGTSNDHGRCRLIFLKDALKNPENKTLFRNGRFIWCSNLRYDGTSDAGLRCVSFTVDRGHKRFQVEENNILTLPSKVCVSNNRYFKSKQKTFLPFSTIFSYEKTLQMMARHKRMDRETFSETIAKQNPYRPGTLVIPRVGYFWPDVDIKKIGTEINEDSQHPCGIILGKSFEENNYVNKEFYRVRFGKTTYERLHPVQLEIVQ